MKKIPIILFVIIFCCSCMTRPKNFTYRYDSKNTGLDQRIDLNGYYISQRGCDSTFYSMYMFYPDGLFTVATTSSISPELIDCFEKGGTSGINRYPLWGVYRIQGDLIRTQAVRMDGSVYTVIFRDYRILPDRSIVNTSDYIVYSNTPLGYLANYPSFFYNPCEKTALFYSLKTRRNPNECPFLKKKWFRF